MSWLLDTSAAILLRDGVGDSRKHLVAIDDLPALAAITRVELESGVYVDPARTARRRAAVDAMLDEFTVIDFTDAMAEAYGRIVAVIGFSRRKVIDRMIAATAIVEGRTLITCNETAFRDIEGLDLKCWPNPVSRPPPSAKPR